MFSILSHELTIYDILSLQTHPQKIELSETAIQNIQASYHFLQSKIANEKQIYYGVNTGFGALCNIIIPTHEMSALQENLVMSHACGVGNPIPNDIVKLMLLLKVQNLSYGHSGVKLDTVERLIAMYNNDIFPIVYDTGSLGASGDLVPLAHLCLPLIGKGKVWYKGVIKDTAEVWQSLHWTPIPLQAKEGLALLNGTQFMSAYGAYILSQFEKIKNNMYKIIALSYDAFDCRIEPFDKRIHDIRRHTGQQAVAAAMRQLLIDSPNAKSSKKNVQDPYSFRCIAQVLGACMTAIEHVYSIVENEINAVTDNPNVFPQSDAILSGGNFHGQNLAMAYDYLAIAISEIANISERRIYQLISGLRGLPPFLNANPGLHSGLMIPQYVAAALVSKNKQLCTPASIDSIPSSNGQEDHVSMGANAATKLLQIWYNTIDVLAIELLTASQAIDLKKGMQTSPALTEFYNSYRKVVDFIAEDRVIHDDIKKTKDFILS